MAEKSSYTSWQEKELAASLDRFPERYKAFYHHGGAEIPRVAFPESIDQDYEENIGFPFEESNDEQCAALLNNLVVRYRERNPQIEWQHPE